MEGVIHLAGAISAPSRKEFWRVNAQGTRYLAEAVARESKDLKKFVCVSSLAAAGPSRGRTPRRESEPDQPVSNYGWSKLEGERAALRFAQEFPLAIVRPPIVYGPWDRGMLPFFQMASRRIAPMFPPVFPMMGDREYSAIHVNDLSRGIVQALETQTYPSGEVFYLAGNGVVTGTTLVDAISSALGNKPVRVRIPDLALRMAGLGGTVAARLAGRFVGTPPITLDKVRELLPDAWLCTHEKAASILGFQPQMDLAEGLASTTRWYQERGWI